MTVGGNPAPSPGTGTPMLPGVAVIVETLLLGEHDGRLTYRATAQVLSDEEHPDAAALRLAGLDNSEDLDGQVLHSTSWRFDDGRIVLTYAALPDPDPRTATAFDTHTHRAPTPPADAHPMRPSPRQVDTADVIAHACRHLAFLRRSSPTIARAAAANPALWTLLDAHRPDVAGSLYQP